MKFIKLTACLLIAISITGCEGNTTIRKHKAFAGVFPKYKSVAIVSADMLVATKGKGGQEVSAIDPERVNNVTQAASSALTKKGYQVKQIICEDDFEDYSEQFNKAYKQSVTGLYANREMNKTSNAFNTSETLGTNVEKITSKYGADMLLVLAYTGNELSQDEVNKNFAKDLAINVAIIALTRGQNTNSGDSTHIKDGAASISLVDGHNGDILWTNVGTDFEDYAISVGRMVTKNNVMDVAFEKALKTLHEQGRE